VRDLIDRYQLWIVLLGLLPGSIAALLGRFGPPLLSRRALGLAVAAGAVLSSVWGPTAAGVAAAFAVACLVVPDSGGQRHPLDRAVYPASLASLAGVFVAVPDVEVALSFIGCLLPIALVRSARGPVPRRWGTVMLTATVVLSVLVGAPSDWTSARASLACSGMLVAAPLVLWRGDLPLGRRYVQWLAAVHLVAAVPVGRLVMRAEPELAVAVAVGSFAVQVGAAAVVRGQVRRRAVRAVRVEPSGPPANDIDDTEVGESELGGQHG
jgi:hypothetical protein